MKNSLFKNLYFCAKNTNSMRNKTGLFSYISRFNYFVLNKNTEIIPRESNLLKYQMANFAKKTPDKNDKKVKTQKEKDTINKEYQDVSTDELKTKYKQKSDNIVITYKEVINEIRVQRSNPKILDSIQVKIYI